MHLKHLIRSLIIILIESHIKSLPLHQSQYTLQKTPNVYYLGDEFCSVAQLHANFLRQYRINVSDKIYRQAFNKFNIHFGLPRSDTCATCDEYSHELMMAKIQRDIEKQTQLKLNHDQHLALNKKYKAVVKSYCKRAEKKKINVVAFDYMQNLPCPNLTVGDVFYSRQLWVYVFGIHSACDNSATMYVYDEVNGEKGSNNVASMLLHYLTNDKKLKSQLPLTLLCDTCPGQNKNFNMVKLCFLLVHVFRMFPSIMIIFPVCGHSYSACDCDFSNIGTKKKQTYAETPSQWADFIRKVRKDTSPFKVCIPEWDDFVNIGGVDGFLPRS